MCSVQQPIVQNYGIPSNNRNRRLIGEICHGRMIERKFIGLVRVGHRELTVDLRTLMVRAREHAESAIFFARIA